MADAAEVGTKKRRRVGLIIGAVLAVTLGSGAFFSIYTGLFLGASQDHTEASQATPLPDIAFVPVEPVVVSLGTAERKQHLRFRSQLEVSSKYTEEVTHLLPRILDVLNGYLRAVDVADLEDPAALVRVRGQLLRRIQMVTGEGRVRDLLISEFVLN